MSAGCQCPGGTAIKPARREGLVWTAAGLVTNKTMRRVTAEGDNAPLRREAVTRDPPAPTAWLPASHAKRDGSDGVCAQGRHSRRRLSP